MDNWTLKELANHLKDIEFSAGGYCPFCGGWNVDKWRGSTPKVHTKTCWINDVIKRFGSPSDSADQKRVEEVRRILCAAIRATRVRAMASLIQQLYLRVLKTRLKNDG